MPSSSWKVLAATWLASMLAATGCGNDPGSPERQPKRWGTPVLIENNDPRFADKPDVAPQTLDGAIAVWTRATESDWADGIIQASRLTPGQGWGPPATLNRTDFAFSPFVARDGGGAVAVWLQLRSHDGSSWELWGSHTTEGKTWEAPTLLGTDASLRAFPLASNVNGTAAVVWQKRGGEVWANLYRNGVWGAATSLGQGPSSSRRIAVDPTGNVFAVWVTTKDALFVNRAAAGGTFGTAMRLDSGALDVSDSSIATGANGNAIVIWSEADFEAPYSHPRQRILASRFSRGAWGAPDVIQQPEPTDIPEPQIGIDAKGNALAVWVSLNMEQTKNLIRQARFTPAGGWSPAADSSPKSFQAAELLSAHLAVAKDGSAVAVWEQSPPPGKNPKHEVFATQFDPATGNWSPPQQISAADPDGVHDSQATIDESGNATAVWQQDSGVIAANRFE